MTGSARMTGPDESPAARPVAGKGDRRINVRVVSDGTAGMRLQAVALAAALRRARPDLSLIHISEPTRPY